jgi:hypothetical protein
MYMSRLIQFYLNLSTIVHSHPFFEKEVYQREKVPKTKPVQDINGVKIRRGPSENKKPSEKR